MRNKRFDSLAFETDVGRTKSRAAIVDTHSSSPPIKFDSPQNSKAPVARAAASTEKRIRIVITTLEKSSFWAFGVAGWHGEVAPRPPFLTAMQTPDEIPVMLGEMATIGVGMAVLVTVV